MDRQKVVSIANKVESLAIGYIGVFFFSMGTSYFQERFLYRVPRILVPIFDTFGNIGLAIGMLILGCGLIFYGFTKWKTVSEKKNLYWILATAGLFIGVALANINFNPNKSADIMDRMDKKREEQINEIRNLGEKTFKNAELNEHIAKFKPLYTRFERSIEKKDADSISACEKDYDIWKTKLGKIIEQMNIDELTEFAPYNAQYSIQWNDLRMKSQEN